MSVNQGIGNQYISPEKIVKSDVSNAVNYSNSEAKVRGTYRISVGTRKCTGKKLIVHLGTNHLP